MVSSTAERSHLDPKQEAEKGTLNARSLLKRQRLFPEHIFRQALFAFFAKSITDWSQIFNLRSR